MQDTTKKMVVGTTKEKAHIKPHTWDFYGLFVLRFYYFSKIVGVREIPINNWCI